MKTVNPNIKIQFIEAKVPSKGVVVVAVSEDNELPEHTQHLDEHLGGFLKKALEHSAFKGKVNETLTLMAPPSSALSHIILLGLGKTGQKEGEKKEEKKCSDTPCDALWAELRGAALFPALAATQAEEVTLYMPGPTQTVESCAHRDFTQIVAHIAYGVLLKSWKFDTYKTKDRKPLKLKTLHVASHDHSRSQSLFNTLEKIADGVFLTRQVVSEPPNVIYPESLAHIAQELKSLGVHVEVLGEKEIEKLGMGALLGVGQGSVFESKLVVMEWKGSGKHEEGPIALVGKGVTFDSGGISIKPSANMDEMKMDMAGAGAVIGTMKALASTKSPAHVVGVVGLVENMPSGSAQRPGDIVTSMSGQTIEILNTDAEGRLVLADALWYTQDRFKPRLIIDLATLTGAIVVALGHEYAGLFSSCDVLSEQLLQASRETGERLWRLPLHSAYNKDIDTEIADVRNTGSGRGAGSITAAHFLERFTNGVPWAHLDIAGVEMQNKDWLLSSKGATGFGVRLLENFVRRSTER